MMTLGLVLFGMGFVGLMATVLYSFVDNAKTGVIFRRKKVVLPIAFGSGAVGLAGMLLVYLSQQP